MESMAGSKGGLSKVAKEATKLLRKGKRAERKEEKVVNEV